MELKGILLFGPRMKWLYDVLQKHESKAKLLWSEDDYEPLTEPLHANTRRRLGHSAERIQGNGA